MSTTYNICEVCGAAIEFGTERCIDCEEAERFKELLSEHDVPGSDDPQPEREEP